MTFSSCLERVAERLLMVPIALFVQVDKPVLPGVRSRS